MRKNKFRKKLKKALDRLIKKDGEMISANLSERSICHRLGIYLYETFREYDVDCEYNGFEENHRNRKVINIMRERIIELNRLTENDTDEDLLIRKVFPDIIIHRRRTTDNLLIIETKKSTNNNQAEIDFDIEKLSRFTSNENGNLLNYQYGLFINFMVSDEPTYDLTWFKNGEQINEEELFE